ncbi:hypothetical protein CGMCC3_g581 [Colletotrichum fructicola]|nr:uncharacterized protein CGMCC3_g581 [Colletotrichum fructicola]KAE9583859.1 hypothetical protein CGMCC3_g581 [Colletotrichum fructicola]
MESELIPWAAASDSKGRQTQHRLKAPPKAEDARSTPGPEHHGICETRIYTGEGFRGQLCDGRRTDDQDPAAVP